MLFRWFVALAALLSLPLSALAADLYPLPDEQLTTATLQIRQRNYHDARESAAKAPQGGIREFLLGLSATRLEKWEEAAGHLAAAADSFPLLADYALYNQARALYRLARFSEALPPLQRLTREFPDSPLLRAAQALQADTFFAAGDFKNAQGAYQKFIEKFPSGSDSLSAIHNSALCLEQLGDTAGAVTALRNIWLRYPTSAIAARAEGDLARLAARGIKIEPYSAEELHRRAATLFDLKKYDAAARALSEIPLDAQSEAAAARQLLKTGLALYRSRKYRDAEATFAALLARKPPREIADDAGYWLARALDRNGKGEEAFATFTRVAESAAGSELAGKALFEAALIRKGQKGEEALAILKNILLSHPAPPLRQSVTWEIAWGSYRAGDWKTAAEHFKTLAESAETREKALYWLGRALAGAGDIPAAQEAVSRLLAEYPFGFYAQTYRKEVDLADEELSFPTRNLAEILPVPAGFERVKALITLGLHDEARKELSLARKKGAAKNGGLPGLARLYLEMEDYHGAYNLLGGDRPRRFEKDNLYRWGLSFPLGYRDQVAKLAAGHNIPESLVYAVIRAESSFSPTALSPVGAVGLMQLMPATAAAMATGNKKKIDSDALTSPETNIRFGVRHLRDLLDLYQGDLVLAVAAYNAGSGNVNRWRERFGNLPAAEFIESIPFGETREYVKKVLSAARIYSRLYKLDVPTAAPSSAPPPREKAKESTEPPPSLLTREAASTTVPTVTAN